MGVDRRGRALDRRRLVMRAAYLVARADVRERWRALLVLSVLIAVLGSMALTSFAGARRAESAFERFRARSNSADAVVESVGGSRQTMDSAGWMVVSRLPGVDRVAPFAFVPFIPSSVGPEEMSGGFVSTDGTWLYEVDVPRVVEGRLPSPERADEVAINEKYAEWLDVTPGDKLSGTTLSPEQSGGEDASGGGQGPSVQLLVTGVVRLPSDISFNAGAPVAYFPPAFYEKYASTVGFASALAWVRLDQDQPFSTFNAALRSLPGYGEHLRASDLSGVGGDVDDATAVQARALVLLGLALALAGMLILAQLMARHMDSANDVQAALRAIGFDERQRCVTAAMPLIAAAFLGVAGSVPLAILASPLLPRGLPRMAEPDPGVMVDGYLLWWGAAAAVLIMTAIALMQGLRLARRTSAGSRTTVGESRTMTRPGASPALAHVPLWRSLPVPMFLGTRFALTWTRTLTPSTGLSTGILGVLAVTAALAFASSADQLVASPDRFGSGYDAHLGLGRLVDPDEAAPEAVAADPAISAVAAVEIATNVTIDDLATFAYAVDVVEGEFPGTVLEGRIPRSPDEVLIGPTLLRRLNRHVDETVIAEGINGPVELRIVGIGLLPPENDATYDESVAVAPALLADLHHDDASFSYLVGWTEGTDIDAARTRLSAAGLSVGDPTPPARIVNMGDVSSYPKVFAGCLAALGLAGVAHALAASGRQQRGELRALHALGVTPRQMRRTVVWQAITYSLVGVLIGVPLGLLLARWMWRLVATSLNVAEDPAVSAALVGLVTLGALVTTLAVSILPARHATRAAVHRSPRAE